MPLWSVSLSSSLCSACPRARMFLLWLHLKLISPALSQALLSLLSGVESQYSSGAEQKMILSWQTVLRLDLFVIPSRMQIESRTQNGWLWSEFAHIWVAFPCQMLVTLVDGFAHAMVHIMIFLAGLGRDQHHTIWRYQLIPSWRKTSCWLVEDPLAAPNWNVSKIFLIYWIMSKCAMDMFGVGVFYYLLCLASVYVTPKFKYYCLTRLVSIIAWLFAYHVNVSKADDFRHICIVFAFHK